MAAALASVSGGPAMDLEASSTSTTCSGMSRAVAVGVKPARDLDFLTSQQDVGGSMTFEGGLACALEAPVDGTGHASRLGMHSRRTDGEDDDGQQRHDRQHSHQRL